MTELANSVEDLPKGIKMSVSVLFYSDSAQTSLFTVSQCNMWCDKVKEQLMLADVLSTFTNHHINDRSIAEPIICIAHCWEMIHSGVTSHFGFSSSVCAGCRVPDCGM